MAEEKPETIFPPSGPLFSQDEMRLEALTKLLIAKGVITQEEFDQACKPVSDKT